MRKSSPAPRLVAVALLAVATLLVGLASVEPVSAQSGTGPRCPVDVMIVLDRSASMYGPPATVARAGAVRLLDGLDDILDYSGVTGFTATLQDKSLDNDHAGSQAAVFSESPATGGPGTQGEAMRDAHIKFINDGRPGAAQFMFVFSDGENADTSAIASAAKSAGIRIFSVATGSQINQAHMMAIASTPKTKYYGEATTVPQAQAVMDSMIETVMGCTASFDFVNSPFCKNGDVVLSPFKVGSSPMQTADARWTFDDGSPQINGSSNTAITKPMAGHHNATLTVTDAAGYEYVVTHELVPKDCKGPRAEISCLDASIRDVVRAHGVGTPGELEITTQEWYVDGEFSGNRAGSMLTSLTPVEFTYVVKDKLGQTDSASVTCDPAPNQAPTLVSTDQTVYAGYLAYVVPVESDPDGDLLQWTWDTSNVPEGASLDDNRFRWPTQPTDAGVYGPINVTVTDGIDVAWTSFFVTVILDEKDPRLDADGDGVPDDSDNCPSIDNHNQQDRDRDGFGDACDGAPKTPNRGTPDPFEDFDSDGIANPSDNCPVIANPYQENLDYDLEGDACDDDMDGDRVNNDVDNCPLDPNTLQEDADGDGTGDVCQAPGDAQASDREGPFFTPMETYDDEALHASGFNVSQSVIIGAGASALVAIALLAALLLRRPRRA